MSANAAINPERLPSELRKDEGDAIRARRQAAGLHVASAAPTADVEGADSAANGRSSPLALPDDLVGLALSGGGIRSASFNLGLLQAFHQRGLLRYVDYLSMVSGGGYIGGYLASMVHAGDKDILTSDRKTNCPLHPCSDGRQPAAVRNLIRGGDYLDRPAEFASRYLLGLVLNSVWLVSGVVMAAACVAFLWRLLDTPWIHSQLARWSREWLLDWNRPFLPAAIFLVTWMLCWLAAALFNRRRNAAKRARTAAKRSLMGAGLSFLVGLVVWLSTPNVNVVKPSEWQAAPLPTGAPDNMFSVHQTAVMIVAMVGALCLLPLLRPWRLLASGTQPRNPAERWTFGMVSRLALAAVLLVPSFFFARHNVSGEADRRGPELTLTDIRAWNSFWDRARQEFAEHEASQEAERAAMKPSAAEAKDAAHRDGGEVAEELAGVADEAPAPDGKSDESADVPEGGTGARDRSLKDQPPGAYIWSHLGSKTQVAIAKADPRPWPYNRVDRRRKARIVERLNDILFGQARSATPGAYDASFLDILPTSFSDWPLVARFASTRANGRLTESMSGFADLPTFRHPAFLTALGVTSLREGADLEGAPQEVKWAVTGAHALPPAKQGRLHDLLVKRGAKKESLEPDETARLNRLLLEAAFPEEVWQRTYVRRTVCIVADQRARLAWLVCSAAVFLLAGLVVNFNATSMHDFYRERLAEGYLRQGHVAGTASRSRPRGETEAHGGHDSIAGAQSESPPGEEPYGLKLSALQRATEERGLPYPLYSAALNRFLCENRKDEPTESFLLSPGRCGTARTGFVKTDDYVSGELTLADAMAISGAAVSPLQIGNPMASAFMLILNLRLGQWLPHPSNNPAGSTWISPLRVIRDLLRPEEQRRYCFLSDGGHHENLGLWPLLERRCRLIIVSDAGQDPEHSLADFTRLFRRARLELGVQFLEPVSDGGDTESDGGVPCIEMEHLIPDPASGLCPYHYCILKARYTSGPGTATEGLIVYLKPSLTGDEELDLARYRAENNGFPHDPTTEQLYDANQFESYRQMGSHIGETLCRELIAKVYAERSTCDLWQTEPAVEALTLAFEEVATQRAAGADRKGRPEPVRRYQPGLRKRPFQLDHAILIGLVEHLARALRPAQRDAAGPGSGTTTSFVDAATVKALMTGITDMESLSTSARDWAANDGQHDLHSNAMQVVQRLSHWVNKNMTPDRRLELSAPTVVDLFRELEEALEGKHPSGDAVQGSPNPGDAPNPDSNGASGASVQA